MGERSRDEMENRDRVEAETWDEKAHLQRALTRAGEVVEEVEAERDQFQRAATDTWAALFAADRVADEVELVSAEHAAMIPGIVRGAFATANEVRRALEDERDRLRAELNGMKALVMQSVRAVVQTAEGTEDETNPVVVRMRQILEQLGDD